MRTLITGANGQLGRHLIAALKDSHELILTDRSQCDLNNAQALAGLLADTQPQMIINTAAMTAVDLAEDEPELADRLNHQVPLELAQWASRTNARLIHYSTDYVFGGIQTKAWLEDDPKSPQSVYGQSKYLGEQAIQSVGVGALILRTAWVYSALPGNFLTAILARASRGEDLRVVNDQVGSPTWAGSLAEATAHLLAGGHVPSDHVRVLHVANRGAVSWHAFATLAVEQAWEAGVIDRRVDVAAVGSDQWPQKAKRPSGSVLDVTQYETLTGQRMASFDQALAQCLHEWRQWQC